MDVEPAFVGRVTSAAAINLNIYTADWHTLPVRVPRPPRGQRDVGRDVVCEVQKLEALEIALAPEGVLACPENT